MAEQERELTHTQLLHHLPAKTSYGKLISLLFLSYIRQRETRSYCHLLLQSCTDASYSVSFPLYFCKVRKTQFSYYLTLNSCTTNSPVLFKSKHKSQALSSSFAKHSWQLHLFCLFCCCCRFETILKAEESSSRTEANPFIFGSKRLIRCIDIPIDSSPEQAVL